MSTQGASPCETKDSSSWEELGPTTIDPSDTEDLDTVPISTFCSGYYVICFQGGGLTKTVHLIVSAAGSDFKDTVHAVLGDSLSVTVKFLKVGTDGVLRLGNGEAFAVTATVQRLLVG